MSPSPGAPSETEPASLLQRLLAIVVLAAWAGTLLCEGAREGILLPYGRWDVGLVSIACGLPAAWLATNYLQRRLFRGEPATIVALLAGATLLGAFRLGFWNVAADAPVAVLEHGSMPTRIAAALLASLGMVFTLFAAGRPWFPPIADEPCRPPYAPCVFATLLLALVPATYERGRLESDRNTALEYLNQSRLAEASHLLKRCLALDAKSSLRGQPIGPLIAELDTKIEAIQRRTTLPLSDEASPRKRIERAMNLAVLGQREDALWLLLPLTQQRDFAAHGGHKLLGTLYQDRGDWEESLFHCRLASEFLREETTSELRQAGLDESIQGQAYALRKLGRINQAEAAYLQLLERKPTAERHFLLAQFYEDIQETSLATQHARQAIKLAPDQFTSSAEALIAKMRTHHFGCFQLWRD